jgi:hypothetical protein
MTILKFLAIGFAFLGLGSAVTAAVYWWKASRVGIPHTVVSISDLPEAHILGTQVAFNESARLNNRAAVWTGASAILSAIASVLGVL